MANSNKEIHGVRNRGRKRLAVLVALLAVTILLAACTAADPLIISGTAVHGISPEGAAFTLTLPNDASWGAYPDREYGRLDDSTFHYGLIASPPFSKTQGPGTDTTVIYVADITKGSRTFDEVVASLLYTDETVREMIDTVNATQPGSLVKDDIILENADLTIDGKQAVFNGRECRKPCTPAGTITINVQYFIEGNDRVYAFIIGTEANETANARIATAMVIVQSFRQI